MFLTGSNLQMVGTLGEKFGFSCVRGVAFLAPIARGKEAGMIFVDRSVIATAYCRFRTLVASKTRC